jgi:hypothetical protein
MRAAVGWYGEDSAAILTTRYLVYRTTLTAS